VVHSQSPEEQTSRSDPLARQSGHAIPAKFINSQWRGCRDGKEQVAEAYDIGADLRHRLIPIRDDL